MKNLNRLFAYLIYTVVFWLFLSQTEWDLKTQISLALCFAGLMAIANDIYTNTKTKWISINTPPLESGRYWCLVEEMRETGISHYQWNCYYNNVDNTWWDLKQQVKVTHWTHLLNNPK